jgi:D-Tyr-tRNAtyr deacylase
MKVAKYLKDDNKKILIVNQQTLYADDIKGISKKYKNVSYMTYKVPA